MLINLKQINTILINLMQINTMLINLNANQHYVN